jgi:uncharacterized protein YfdQ (DUF2303 family)
MLQTVQATWLRVSIAEALLQLNTTSVLSAMQDSKSKKMSKVKLAHFLLNLT